MGIQEPDNKEFIKLFIKLAKKSLKISKKNIAILKIKYSVKRVGDLERAFHTLKSQADVMGYAKTACSCGIVEEFLRKMKESGEELTKKQMAGLERILTCLGELIVSIEKNGKETDFLCEAEKFKNAAG